MQNHKTKFSFFQHGQQLPERQASLHRHRRQLRRQWAGHFNLGDRDHSGLDHRHLLPERRQATTLDQRKQPSGRMIIQD